MEAFDSAGLPVGRPPLQPEKGSPEIVMNEGILGTVKFIVEFFDAVEEDSDHFLIGHAVKFVSRFSHVIELQYWFAMFIHNRIHLVKMAIIQTLHIFPLPLEDHIDHHAALGPLAVSGIPDRLDFLLGLLQSQGFT
jgi:hypothetical protein